MKNIIKVSIFSFIVISNFIHGMQSKPEIIYAWYGNDDPKYMANNEKTAQQVINKLRSIVDKYGFIAMPADQHKFYGFDPLPNVKKTTAIHVRYNGKEQHLRAAEGTDFVYPTNTDPNLAQKAFQEIKATLTTAAEPTKGTPITPSAPSQPASPQHDNRKQAEFKVSAELIEAIKQEDMAKIKQIQDKEDIGTMDIMKEAIELNKYNVVKHFLDAGKQSTWAHFTFSAAKSRNNIPIVELALESGAGGDAIDYLMDHPLKINDLNQVKKILALGQKAEANNRVVKDFTAKYHQHATANKIAEIAIKNKNAEILELAIEAGAGILPPGNYLAVCHNCKYEHHTLSCEWCGDGRNNFDNPTLRNLQPGIPVDFENGQLLQKNALTQISAGEQNLLNAVSQAIHANNFNKVKQLIENAEDILVEKKHLPFVLQYAHNIAVQENKNEIANYLKEHGAVDASQGFDNPLYKNLIEFAVLNNNLSIIEKLLIKKVVNTEHIANLARTQGDRKAILDLALRYGAKSKIADTIIKPKPEVIYAWYGNDNPQYQQTNEKTAHQIVKKLKDIVYEYGFIVIPANQTKFYGFDPITNVKKTTAIHTKYQGKEEHIRAPEGTNFVYPANTDPELIQRALQELKERGI